MINPGHFILPQTIHPRCPWCLDELGRHGSITDKDARPDPGDVTLCLSCGGWCVYAANEGGLSLRQPNGAEWKEIRADNECQQTHATWQKRLGKRWQQRKQSRRM